MLKIKNRRKDRVDATPILLFYAMEKDSLLTNKSTPATDKKIRTLDFFIDELAIRLLENDCIKSC